MTKRITFALLSAVLPILGGCNSFLDQSELTRGHSTERLVVPILSSIDPIDMTDQEFPSATDITPEDLKVIAVDYVIGANDLLTVSVYDLVAGGVESVRTARVSETGTLSLPLLGEPVQAAGLTEAQLQRSVADRYREAGILQNAQVSVTVNEMRQRTFSALGAVARAGQYAILEADFRMLDALIQVGDVTYPADYIYVLRRTDRQATTTQPTPLQPGMQSAPSIPPPSNQAAPTDLAPRSAAPDAPVRPILAAMQEAAGGQPSNAPTAEERYIYVDGRPVLVGTTQPTTRPIMSEQTTVDRRALNASEASMTMRQDASPSMAMAPEGSGAMQQRPYEFGEGLEEPDNIRVIRVPLQQLRQGDLRFNIVIRPGDRLIVPLATIGEYYVGGHAAGGGVFSLTGRQITLTQAIVSARMLDPLAVPWRTDIIRRIGRDRQVFVRVNLQQIFQGRQPDIFLKPNDQVLVGSDFWAPFLAAVRGAFRASYGFGFIYDRNFAPQQEQDTE